MSIRANLEYTLPGMCPAWVQAMQRDFAWTSNQLMYAVSAARRDVERLRRAAGG